MNVLTMNSRRQRRPPRSPWRETEMNSTRAIPSPDLQGRVPIRHVLGGNYGRRRPVKAGGRRLIKPAVPLLGLTTHCQRNVSLTSPHELGCDRDEKANDDE